MQAINQNKDVNKMYGWISIGANGSTNNKGHAPGVPANWPSAYDEYPNTVVLDQAALYFERLPDTTQTKHFDWGYRVTGLYGQDYRFTTAKGMLTRPITIVQWSFVRDDQARSETARQIALAESTILFTPSSVRRRND